MRGFSAVATTLTLAVMLALAPSAGAASFDYPFFSETDTLTYNGSATRDGAVMRLTSGGSQAGSVFTEPALWRTSESFSTRFSFDISGGPGPPDFPGDGMAFVIQRDSRGPSALGVGGGAMGYGGQDAVPPISPSLVVELDIWDNADGEADDPNDNHIALKQNGDHVNNLAVAPDPGFDLYDAGPAYVWVDYDAAVKTVRVFADDSATKPAMPLISHTIDLGNLLGAGNARLGFSGGTGFYWAVHDVLSWSFASGAPPDNTVVVPPPIRQEPVSFFDCGARQIGESMVDGCFTQENGLLRATGEIMVDGVTLEPDGPGALLIDKATGLVAASDNSTEVLSRVGTGCQSAEAVLGRLVAWPSQQMGGSQRRVFMKLRDELGARVSAGGLLGGAGSATGSLGMLGQFELRRVPGELGSRLIKGSAKLPAMLGGGAANVVLKSKAMLRRIDEQASRVVSSLAYASGFFVQNLSLKPSSCGLEGTATVLAMNGSINLYVRLDKVKTDLMRLTATNLELSPNYRIESLIADWYNDRGREEFRGSVRLTGGLRSNPLVVASGGFAMSRGALGGAIGSSNASVIFANLGLGSASFEGHEQYLKMEGSLALSPLPHLRFSGRIGGWFDRGAGYNLEGQGTLTVPGWTIGGRGLISTKGMAACGDVAVKVGSRTLYTINIGFGQKLGQPAMVYLTGCDIGPFRAFRSAHASAAARAFTLPAGLPAALVALRGRSGAPTVTLRAPGGRKVRVITRGRAQMPDGGTLQVKDDEGGITHLLLARPAEGRWTIDSGEGPAITDLRVANGLPDPSVKVRVRGKGARRTVSWKVRRIPGQTVTLYEEGAGVHSAIATLRGTRGRRRFTPADGVARKRKLIAIVEQGGLPRATLGVGRYTAPAVRPRPPGRITVKRKGTTITMRWARAKGALAYRGTVVLGRKRIPILTRSTRFSLVGMARKARGSVRLQAVDDLNRASRARSVRIR